MKNILSRLKSPVVIVQFLTIIGTAVILFVPGYDEQVRQIAGALAVIVNVVAGLNNPTDRENF